jgi:hypothetical protein
MGDFTSKVSKQFLETRWASLSLDEKQTVLEKARIEKEQLSSEGVAQPTSSQAQSISCFRNIDRTAPSRTSTVSTLGRMAVPTSLQKTKKKNEEEVSILVLEWITSSFWIETMQVLTL